MKQTIKELLQAFNHSHPPKNPKTLNFIGVDGYDVYNPSAPFVYEGKTLIIARVEKRDSEVSKAIFFEKNGDDFVIRKDLKPLDLQDPCITMMENMYRWYLRLYGRWQSALVYKVLYR